MTSLLRKGSAILRPLGSVGFLGSLGSIGPQAARINSVQASQSRRNYASPTSVQQQITATATVTATSNATTARPITEVPGPRRFPFLGSVPSMILDKDFNRDNLNIYWRKLKEMYGDVVRFDIPGWGPMVIIYHPDDCQKLTQVTMKNPIRNASQGLEKIRKEAVDDYFENKPGLLTSNGEEWWRVRSRVQTPMMKPKNVSAYMTQMDEVMLEFTDKIAAFQKEHGEMPSNFQTELYKWALESVCLVALNRRMGCLDPNLPSDSEPMILIREANNVLKGMSDTEYGPQLWRFFPTPAYMRLKRSHDAFLRTADENIKVTEAKLLAKDPNSEEDMTLMETLLRTPGLSRKDVITLILDMLFAGIDTTSHTGAFALYLLARNPKVQTKLHEEIDTVLKGHDGPLTASHLGRMSYLKAVVKESLRVFPVGQGTIRTLERDIVLGGYLIPKGFIVGSWNMFMAEDERIFPRAKEFIPERWSRDRPLGPIHPHASQPFGLGTRMCIGRRIAEQELYIFLTRIMQRFKVDYKYKDMGVITRLISVPSEPLRFEFTERR